MRSQLLHVTKHDLNTTGIEQQIITARFCIGVIVLNQISTDLNPPLHKLAAKILRRELRRLRKQPGSSTRKSTEHHVQATRASRG